MYWSETLGTITLLRALPIDGVRWLFAQVRSFLEDAGPGASRGRRLHDVLRLDIVASTGHPPATYGWHVDDQLQVGWHGAAEPLRMIDPEPNSTGPGRGYEAGAYRLQRTRQSAPRLSALRGEL